jgi:peroxiredoxin
MNQTALRPKEGWNVLHLFYQIDHAAWCLLNDEDQLNAKAAMSSLVQEVRGTKNTQLLAFSVVSLKADLGFMLLKPDLHFANAIQKKVSVSLGYNVLSPVFNFYSLTERSEYVISEDEYHSVLVQEKQLRLESPGFEQLMDEFKARMQKYVRDRLYPNLQNWPVICFYPMSKRRGEENNWYRLAFEERKQLMAGHRRVGRPYAGRVLQLISGATSLDDWEWGVTLLAKDVFEIKSIVYEMRFDEVSARFAEFGDFFVGLKLPLDLLLQSLLLP